MADNIERLRLGRPSTAHSSARRERAANAPPATKRGRRRRGRNEEHQNVVESSSCAPEEPQEEEERKDVDIAQEVEDQVAQREPMEEEVVEDEEEDVYGGGPTDLSLLVNYHNHGAVKIWNQKALFDKPMKCISNGKKVINLPKPDDNCRWFWDGVRATGLEPLVHINFSVIDWAMTTAFCERWHPETATFHLPVGEVSITFDDIQCLLHLPIEGKFLNHDRMQRDEAADMTVSFLGCSADEVNGEFHYINGPHLTHPYLQQVYMDLLEKAGDGAG